MKNKEHENRIKQESKVIAAYYERNPDIFVEECLGIELKWYERIWMRFKSKVGGWFAKSK